MKKPLRRMSPTRVSSRHSYYGENQCQVPFQWEVQPGKPKDPPKENESVSVPAIGPPPSMKGQNWAQIPKATTNKALSCFYANPKKTLKAKKGNEMVVQKQNDILGQAETSDDDYFSISPSPYASRSSSSNTAEGSSSSKTLARLQSSQCLNLAKWVLKGFA